MTHPPVPKIRRVATVLVPVFITLVSMACAGPAAPPTPEPDASSRRDAPVGSVVGFRGEYGNHAWLGIPFAQPPIGELRWRAPRAASTWPGTREAVSFGASCAQFASPIGGDDSAPPGTPVGSEDCLTLNIYAPAWAANRVPSGEDRLPVMFWIHGGGNTIGTSSFYNGGNLAASQDVIVVTVNYRLGSFGWFRHPALAEGASRAERSGNFAVLDLIAALTWVRDNISHFGGAAENVTLFGESAGAHNVAMLLVSPMARGLFDRAIMQSGGIDSEEVDTASNYVDDVTPGAANSSQEVTLRLLMSDGTAPNRDAAKAHAKSLRSAALAANLRARPANEILSAYDNEGIGMYDLPLAIRDGVVLPRREFAEIFASGNVAPVPLMLGTNRDENKLFLFLDPSLVRRWFGVLPQLLDRERYEALARYQSRSWKARAVDELAIALTASGRREIFAYRWDFDEEATILWADLGQLLGAAHGFEIAFVFGHFDMGREGRFLYDEAGEPGRTALSNAMMSYWAEFAYSRDPGTGRRGELPRWTAWDPRAGADKFVILDTPSGGGPRMSTEFVTGDRVLAELRADPLLQGTELRCEVLGAIDRWPQPVDDTDYAGFGCSRLPAVAAGGE